MTSELLSVNKDLAEKNAAIAKKNWERISVAMNFEEPDQVPFFIHASGPFYCSLAGVNLHDYFHDPLLMLNAQISMYNRFPGLTGIHPDLGLAAEPSALGAEITFTDDGTPWAVPFIKTEEDIEKLQVPDIENGEAGWMSTAMNYFKFMSEKMAGSGLPVMMGSGHSPWGIACLIRDTEKLLADIVNQPAFAKKLLRKTTDLQLTWLKLQQKLMPPQYFKRIVIWDDLASFVTLEQFREFILPVYLELYETFPDCQRWYHNDADATPILEGLMEAGIQMFHYGFETKPEVIKERIGHKVCLMGNVPPLHVLRDGKSEDVDLCVKDIIAKSGRGGGLVVSAGGFIDEGTPAENIKAMMRACEKYGKRDYVHRLAADFYSKVALKARKTEQDVTLPGTVARPADEVLGPLMDAIIAGRLKEMGQLVKGALEQGAAPQGILEQALIPGMEEVGQRFSDGEIFLPEMMFAAKAMHEALAILGPLLAGTKLQRGEKVAIGTVKDDLHDIGKNIAISMMQGAGFDVIDLGVNCPPERFVQAVESGAGVIGMSAILTTVLHNVEETIDLLKKKGLRDRVIVLVGGASVTPSFAQKAGADAYCDDAGVGARKAKELLSQFAGKERQ
jgi:5-methyltetrahydrofolate--homocysteine methyltransferase